MGRSSKDKRDIFYRLAKEEGWRARSAFKLLQIQETLNILDNVTRAVDLCAAPGSWSQVLAQTLKPSDESGDKPYIVAVDLQTMSPIPGVKCIKGDITSEETANQIIEALGGSKAQIVVCDGAPDVTGLHELDERLQSQLLFAALSIATCILEENGTFVSKFFRASDEGIRFNFSRVRYFFEDVTLAKPRSSRASSMECFIVGRKFHLPENYTPKVAFPNWPRNIPIESAEIPFVTCGDLSGFDSETTYPLPDDYVCREPVQKPIDPPYATAVQLKKTEKLSNKTRDLNTTQEPMEEDSDPVLQEAKYTLNTEVINNRIIVEKIENLSIHTPIDIMKTDTAIPTSTTLITSDGDHTAISTPPVNSNVFEMKPGLPQKEKWTAINNDPCSDSTNDTNKAAIEMESDESIAENLIKLIPSSLEKFIVEPDSTKNHVDSTPKIVLTVNLSFRGGLETIFGGKKDVKAELPSPSSGAKWTMELLLEWMKDNIIEERPELFIKDGDIRPGILIFVNDTDWELFDKFDYELAPNDRISFISTLHGG